MVTEQMYLGPDKTWRTLGDHLAYLERCAQAWERGDCCNAPEPLQAARVRAMAQRIADEA